MTKSSKFDLKEQTTSMIERGQASPQPQVEAVPVPPESTLPTFTFHLPQMPNAGQVPGKRENLSARVLPHLRDGLKRYVSSLTSQGFEISQHEVLEHWLVQLQDPEYAQALAQQLVEARYKK